MAGQDEGGRAPGRQGVAMAKPDEVAYYEQEKLLQVDYDPPKKDWLDNPVDLRPVSITIARS